MQWNHKLQECLISKSFRAMALNLLQDQLNHGETTFALLTQPFPKDKVKYVSVLNYFGYTCSNTVIAEECSNTSQQVCSTEPKLLKLCETQKQNHSWIFHLIMVCNKTPRSACQWNVFA